MWGKLKKKISQPEFKPTKDNRTEYDKHFSLDFSDGPPPIKDDYRAPSPPLSLVWPEWYDSGPYRINGYTVTPFIESLALEPLVAPARLSSPEIKIIPPTPPWVTPFGSRRGSKENSPPRSESPGHRKALSDTPIATAKARPDAMRRGRETERATQAASKAAIDPKLLEAANAAHCVINWSLPLRYSSAPASPVIAERSTSLCRNPHPDVPEDVIDPGSPPFAFDD